ncbi:hypothetical protein LB505_001971 [Fusarium chuoi]|nr:hypothetical protein LB505_001971 [Fusarium chuoi]
MRFDPGNNNILSWRDEDEHFKLRSKMSAGYGGREVENLEPKIDKNILSFMNLLGKYADEKKPVDFGRRAQFFTLDVISDLAFDHGGDAASCYGDDGHSVAGQGLEFATIQKPFAIGEG